MVAEPGENGQTKFAVNAPASKTGAGGIDSDGSDERWLDGWKLGGASQYCSTCRANLGSGRDLACSLRRLAAMFWRGKSSGWRGRHRQHARRAGAPRRAWSSNATRTMQTVIALNADL